MYISKYLSQCGICSRRKVVNIIKLGLIKVNDQVIKNPSYKVSKDDLVDALSMQKELVNWHRNVEKEKEMYSKPVETYRKAFGASRKKESNYVRY